MRRHEYLKSAITAFVAAGLFLVAGLVLNGFVFEYKFGRIPQDIIELLSFLVIALLIAAAAIFAIIGIFAMYNESLIENGEDIYADITGIKEYFYGSGNANVHYNLFCQWRCPANGRMYKYCLKNIPTNPAKHFPDNKIHLRISKKDPKLHYIDF